MKKISWQKGLYRVYIVIGILGLVVALYGIKLRYYDTKELSKLSETATETLQKADAVQEELKNNSCIQTNISNALALKVIYENPFESSSYLHRARHRGCWFGLDKAIGDSKLPQAEVILLNKYINAINALPYMDSEHYQSSIPKTLRKSEGTFFLAGTLIFLPWILHFLARFTIVPTVKWIASGFKPQ